jgi:Zn-dependent protease with chaperone function
MTMRSARRFAFALLGVAAIVSACATTTTSAPPSAPQPTRTSSGAPSGRPVDPKDAERLQRVMIPLLQAMNHPRQPSQVKIGIMDDEHINAASAGGGHFYVTRGLLEKANDAHLSGVLAHELAHDDLNHVAKAQTLGAGLNIGMIILDQIIPGSRVLTPIAGELIARKYSRNEEYAADRHGAEILQRAGLSPTVMIDTLSWLMQIEGTGGSGGFFATHPGTQDRIEALKREIR